MLLFDLQNSNEQVAKYSTAANRSFYCVGWSGMEEEDTYEDLQLMSGSSDKNLRFWDPKEAVNNQSQSM